MSGFVLARWVCFLAGLAMLCSIPLQTARGANGWSGYGQLSPEQQRLLQSIYAEYSGQLYALKGEILAAQAELEARLAAPSVDGQQIEPVVERLNRLRNDFLATRVDMIVDMRRSGLPFFGLEAGPGRSGGLLGGPSGW